jgi:hypothetical protein
MSREESKVKTKQKKDKNLTREEIEKRLKRLKKEENKRFPRGGRRNIPKEKKRVCCFCLFC